MESVQEQKTFVLGKDLGCTPVIEIDGRKVPTTVF
jgi:hypothetical protein